MNHFTLYKKNKTFLPWQIATLLYVTTSFSGYYELAIINDKDGYTNVRKDSTINSLVIDTLFAETIFPVHKTNGDWWGIINKKGKIYGFMHKSRIAPILELPLSKIKPLFDDNWEKKNKEYKIGTVDVELFEAINKNLSQYIGLPHYCSSYLEIKGVKDKIVRKYFPDIEPLGGWSGIWNVIIKDQSNYLFFVKHGDYDGRLIIVDEIGNVDDIEGGYLFSYKDFIISMYSTDGGIYPIVWNLKKRNKTFDFMKDETIPGKYENRNYKFIVSDEKLFLELKWYPSEKSKLEYFILNDTGGFELSDQKPKVMNYITLLPNLK